MRFRTRLKGGLLALGAISVAAGCGGIGQQLDPGPFERAQAGEQRVSIHVTNLNFSEATLWAVTRGGRDRLGTVGGKGDAVYTLPWNIPQPLQIEIDLLAGPRCMTAPLEVDPGDQLDLQIELDLGRQPNCR